MQLFPGVITEQKLTGVDIETTDYEVFGEKQYGVILDTVLSKLSGITDCVLLDSLFACEGNSVAMFRESLYVLLENIKLCSWPTKKLDTLVRLIIKLYKTDCLFTVILRASFQYERIFGGKYKDFTEWEQLCQTLISVPERISNKMQGKVPDELSVEHFSRMMFLQIAKCLGVMSQATVEISIKPLVKLLSLCANFTRFDSARNFIQLITIWCNKRPEFDLLIQRIFRDIDQRSVDPFALLILQSSDQVTKLIGPAILERQSWHYVLCRKFPFLCFDSNDRLISNLVKHLGDLDQLETILKELVKIWSDRSALKHTLFQQHLYISKLIILSFKLVSKKVMDNDQLKADITTYLLEGVSVHLDSTIETVRALGMITAELLINTLNSNSENKLTFDYAGIKPDQQEVVNMLKTYDFYIDTLDMREEDVFEKLLKDATSKCSQTKTVAKLKLAEKGSPSEINQQVGQDVLDSDDEFEPYDTSNDMKASVKKRPKYLRDLIEGFREQKDHEIFLESINTAAELIHRQLPDDDVSLGIDILHLLCTLEENFYCENFEDLKFSACLAVLQVYPRESAEFLCEQFHAPTGKYSIGHKLLFLELLSAGASSLSAVKKEANTSDKELKNTIKMKIVGKTRKIASATVIKKGQENRFAKAVGSFFFPLIRGKHSGINVLYKPSGLRDDTTLILIHLLRTLAVIISCSANLGQLLNRMSVELLEAVWSLRFHTELKVREAVVACMGAVVVTLPEYVLVTELLPELLEARQWLADLVSSQVLYQDVDEYLKLFAAQVLLYIEQNVSLEKILKNISECNL